MPDPLGPLALVQLVAETHMQALCQAVWLPEFIDLVFFARKSGGKRHRKSYVSNVFLGIDLGIDLVIDFTARFSHRF